METCAHFTAQYITQFYGNFCQIQGGSQFLHVKIRAIQLDQLLSVWESNHKQDSMGPKLVFSVTLLLACGVQLAQSQVRLTACACVDYSLKST